MEASQHVVTVFGSSSDSPKSEEDFLAYRMGKALAGAGFVVCNGGYGGTMESSARGAKDAGGKTIGVITSFYLNRKPNRWIDKVINVDTMLHRLLELIKLGDAYVVLPGGTGTLLEFAAVLEMTNKSVIPRKPIVTVGKFWDDLFRLLERQFVHEGGPALEQLVFFARSPEESVDFLINQLRIHYAT
jgi:hypothetical protein